MIVVSNTSPIVNLAVVGRLDLLRQLYDKIIIPQAVYHELVILGTGQPGASQVKESAWIETHPAHNEATVASLQLQVDAGEAEAIALAAGIKADLLLLDERSGRAVASRLGLKFIGLLGVLIEAKEHDLIPTVKPAVDDLIEKAGFWISRELYERVLQAANEYVLE